MKSSSTSHITSSSCQVEPFPLKCIFCVSFRLWLTNMHLRFFDVLFTRLNSLFVDKTVFYLSSVLFFLPLKQFAAVYRPHCDLQKKEIERIQREENMSLPQDMDYFSLPASLSLEVREILDRVRPSTVSLHTQKTVTFNKNWSLCFFFSIWLNQNTKQLLTPSLSTAGCCITFTRHNSSCNRPSSQLRAPDKSKRQTSKEEAAAPEGAEWRGGECEKGLCDSVKNAKWQNCTRTF